MLNRKLKPSGRTKMMRHRRFFFLLPFIAVGAVVYGVKRNQKKIKYTHEHNHTHIHDHKHYHVYVPDPNAEDEDDGDNEDEDYSDENDKIP